MFNEAGQTRKDCLLKWADDVKSQLSSRTKKWECQDELYQLSQSTIIPTQVVNRLNVLGSDDTTAREGGVGGGGMLEMVCHSDTMARPHRFSKYWSVERTKGRYIHEIEIYKQMIIDVSGYSKTKAKEQSWSAFPSQKRQWKTESLTEKNWTPWRHFYTTYASFVCLCVFVFSIAMYEPDENRTKHFVWKLSCHCDFPCIGCNFSLLDFHGCKKS